MSDRPIEELQAGDAFRQSMLARANADSHGAPLWHGWVIMDAFLAGIDWARGRQRLASEAELEAAIVRLNDVLNEMWGRDDCKEWAAPLGARQIDKLMDAQNAAFALVSRK